MHSCNFLNCEWLVTSMQLILPALFFLYVIPTDNKQFLDEVEHDIMNYQNRGLCYLPKPKAEADNTVTRF